MAALYAQNAIARIKVEQAQAALNAAEANLEAAKAHHGPPNYQASPEAIAQQKQTLEQVAAAIPKTAARATSQRSPKPLYRRSLRKTADHRRHCRKRSAYSNDPRDGAMPGQPEAASTAGRNTENWAQVNAEAAALKKSFPGTITEISGGTVTVTITDKLEELQAGTDVSISLKK